MKEQGKPYGSNHMSMEDVVGVIYFTSWILDCFPFPSGLLGFLGGSDGRI